MEAMHPEKCRNKPFYQIGLWPEGDSAAHDLGKYKESLEKLKICDIQTDQVFIILAHDEHLLDVLDFFPRDVNQWREKGWGDRARWMFLVDFKAAMT
jgi:hypothetical protein